jgi:hypothetical protein
VLSHAATSEEAALVHQAALLVLRPNLKSVELEPTDAGWPEGVRSAVQALHTLGAEQGRVPPVRRIFARTGVDLDPAVDQHFEIVCALAPHTLLADGWDLAGNNVYSATDAGGLWLRLSRGQHEQLTEWLQGSGVDPAILIRRR